MRYIGIRPQSQVPKYAEHSEYSHTVQRGGKTVEYYHVWLRDEGWVGSPFGENEEPNKPKIKHYSEKFG